MSKKTAKTSAFILAGVLLLIIAVKGGAAEAIALGALAIIGGIVGINLNPLGA